MYFCHITLLLIMYMQTAPSFTWDRATKKFVGPVQKAYMEQDIAKAIKIEDNKQVI